LQYDQHGYGGGVGIGLSEMRIHDGPGYRVYFMPRGAELS
jgi:putative component of toxin-antitoxin plasmid stabilization module